MRELCAATVYTLSARRSRTKIEYALSARQANTRLHRVTWRVLSALMVSQLQTMVEAVRMQTSVSWCQMPVQTVGRASSRPRTIRLLTTTPFSAHVWIRITAKDAGVEPLVTGLARAATRVRQPTMACAMTAAHRQRCAWCAQHSVQMYQHARSVRTVKIVASVTPLSIPVTLNHADQQDSA